MFGDVSTLKFERGWLCIVRIRKTTAVLPVLPSLGIHFLSCKSRVINRLPQIPRANDDHHIVVINIHGGHPSVFKVFSKPEDTLEPTTRDADKMLFIFVSVKPVQLKIDSPPEGYRLGDGQPIKVDIELVFQVIDVDAFWKAAKDPIEALILEVKNEVKKYFLSLDSTVLIAKPLESHQGLEHQIARINISTIAENLEKEILNNPTTGLKIERVYAIISLSEQLNALLERLGERIFGPKGVLDRRHVDAEIARDRTFSPYNLKEVIMALDTQLLENFYTISYGEAMQKVHERLAKEKTAFIDRANKEIEQLSKYINTAQGLELDEMDIKELKEKIAEKMLSVANAAASDNDVSNSEFINKSLRIIPHNQSGISFSSQLEDNLI